MFLTLVFFFCLLNADWVVTKAQIYSSKNNSTEIWIEASGNCSMLGFEFVGRNRPRRQSLCRIPDLQRPVRSTNFEANELIVAAYNIFSRPYFVSHDGQQERICRIPKALLEAVPRLDVVIFSEAFLTTCWSWLTLRKLLVHYGMPYSTATIGGWPENNRRKRKRRFIKLLNGGVFIASRWPIMATSSHVYSTSTNSEADQFSAKGIVYAKLDKLGTIYHVLGTHLQAQSGASNRRSRIGQALEVAQFVRKLHLSSKDAVIVAGDLNCDWLADEEKNHVVQILNTLNIDLTVAYKLLNSAGPNATFESPGNDLVYHSGWPVTQQFLDYVMPLASHRRLDVNSSRLRVVKLRSLPPVDYCSSAPFQPYYRAFNSIWCSKMGVTRDLSDHHLMIGEFLFRPTFQQTE